VPDNQVKLREAKQASNIAIATDADREGETITVRAQHGNQKNPLVCTEIAGEKAGLAAIAHPAS